MKILLIDKNHNILKEKLSAHGFTIDEDYTSNKIEIQKKIASYHGIVVRSRFPIDKEFLDDAKNLKFIGRVGAGLENIDIAYAEKLGITLFNAPEGNRDAVGEHALGMLLSIMNNFRTADQEVRNGIWKREENRGEEIKGKVIALIGYGNMGKAFAQRLMGFGAEVIFYDIQSDVGNEYGRQTDMAEVFERADVLSLHIPQTPLTIGLVNEEYINKFKKPFYLINTARGKSVVIKDLIIALQSNKIKGAGLDVLAIEKSSFEELHISELPEDMKYLLTTDKVLFTPHVAGWTQESKIKLAEVIADKIISHFK